MKYKPRERRTPRFSIPPVKRARRMVVQYRDLDHQAYVVLTEFARGVSGFWGPVGRGTYFPAHLFTKSTLEEFQVAVELAEEAQK